MFRRQYCAIFRELTVPDQICYTNVMDAKTGGSEKVHSLSWASSSERTPTLTTPGFSIHDVNVTDLIRNCEFPEDGAVLAPKHVGAAITF
jgi:hypothetical protein